MSAPSNGPNDGPNNRPKNGPDAPDGSEGSGGKNALAERYRYKKMGAAYQGAMESVFAIAVGTAGGYFADGYFGTTPWLLALGATIGFAAFVLRLTRLGAALNQAASAEEPSEEDRTEPRE